MLGGGIPERYVLLISGTCGAGKTIFGLQFVQSNEPGVYVSFEEELDEIRQNALVFGWDLAKLEKQNKLRLLKYDPFKLEDILEVIENNIREIGAKRVVFDSIAALGVQMKEPSELRRMILQINNIMKKNKCTTIIISEILPGSTALSRFGVEEFVADGVVVLNNFVSENQFRRTAAVWKLRGVNHSRAVHSYSIGEKGLAIGPSIGK